MRSFAGFCLLFLAACSGGGRRGQSAEPAPGELSSRPISSSFALVGGTVVGQGRADVTIRDGRVAAVGASAGDAELVDVSGRFLVPAFIDAHVHLSYYPVARELVARGVVAAVDLAAPLDAFSLDVQPLTLLASGPMITAVAGYPTRSWGSEGYGLEVANAAEAEAAVDELFRAGAALIKTPFTEEPTLADDVVQALVARAHQHDLKVIAHALSASDARRAAAAGVDVLGHTPVEALDAATLDAFADKAVVSTLAAFGGGAAAVENVRALRQAGATVLYGTDLGNTRDAGIQASELALLELAGLDGAAILEAGTRAPARYFGLPELGEIAPGKRAALLVLAEDPLQTPTTLAHPVQVYVDGKLQP
jgi:imidazolonepropionase-like amidohydrolase